MIRTRPLAIGLPPMETRRSVVLHLARRAEQLGYQAFYLAEAWGHDAGVLLAEVAARTDRIRLGTGVLNVWGRSPANLAMLASSLHEVSGGRFELGLGVGSPQLAEGLHDVAFRDPVGRLATVTRQVRRLLAGERVLLDAPGAHRPLRLATEPVPELPINLAALGPRAIRVAGELADAWYPFLLPISGLPAGIAQLDRGAVGRADDTARPLISPCLPTAVAPDLQQARRLASWWVVFYLTTMGPLYPRTLYRLGHGAAVEAVLRANPTRHTAEVPAAAHGLLDELTVWGDVERARATLDRWYASGAQLPVLALPPNRPPAELEYMLEALAPAALPVPTAS